MRNRRRLWLTLAILIGLGALQLGGPRPVADACSVAGPAPMGPVLGVPDWTSTTDEAPSNAASLDPERGEPFVSAGATLYRIPPGTAVVDGDTTVALSDTPDTEAPTLALESATWRAESACSGCAYGGVDTSNVTLDVTAEDDFAGAEHITYAIYRGATEAEAIAASGGEPELWLLPEGGRVWFFLSAAEMPSFVVVRAFDQAGNASEASAPRAIEE
jgi:hypothetical protein